MNIAKTKIDWKKIYSQRERKEVIDKTYAPQTTSAFDVWYAYQYTSPHCISLKKNVWPSSNWYFKSDPEKNIQIN